MRRLRFTVIVALALAAVLAAWPADAQITRGAISGVAKDSSGAVVPGVTVVVTNVGTKVSRDAVTDAQGFFRISALEPGTYTVAADLSGFNRFELQDIVVRSAGEVTADILLKPATVGETITVTARSTTAELAKTTPTISSTVTSKQVVDLPLSGGRDVNTLILTVPNASSTTGQGTYAINGSRPRNNNYMIDGSDNNDISVTIATSQLVPEAIAEYQVMQNPYSVEFGRNTGGQVNVITRSGANRFQAEGWDYYISSDFYSLTNLEKASGLSTPARFNRNQLGADAGGPIIKGRTFFFGLYQWDPQRPGPTPGANVRIPTPEGWAALQNAPLGPGQTAQSRADILSRLSFLQDLYGQGIGFRSLTNQSINGTAVQTGLTNINAVAPNTFNYILGRVDHRVTNKDNATFRYYYNKREYVNAISNCTFGALFCGNQDLLDTNLAASWTRIFSSSVLNEFRFSLVRRDLQFPENDPSSPTAAISGWFTVGGASNFPQGRLSNAYQFSDTVTWNLSKHTLKFGADIRYNTLDNTAAFDSKGTFNFNSLQDYINNVAFSFAQALQTASFDATQWQTYLFLQDDFRLTPELTLNLGLRYEISTVPLGMFGATDEQSLNALVPGPVQMDKNNWAPRVGFAWSPRSNNALIGDGQTVFRGGYGIGYDVIFYNLLTVNASNYPRVNVPTVFNVQNVYPNVLPKGNDQPVFNALNGWVNSVVDTQNPRQQFYSLSWQRQVGNYYLFEVGWSGSKGDHMINQQQANPPVLTADQAALVRATLNSNAIPGTQARRLYPQYGARTLIPAYVGPGGNDAEARSDYNAFFVSGRRNFHDGLQFGGSYTYSRWSSNNDASLGEGGTNASSQIPQDFFDISTEWSRSAYDRPHRFTANATYELPGRGATGLLGQIAGGWQLTGVVQYQSGQPFTIRTGVDSNGNGTAGSDRPDVNASGTLVWDEYHRSFVNNGYYVTTLGTNGSPLINSQVNGNAPRNSERAAGWWNTDFGVSKRFPIGQSYFQVRVDVFNLFNQDNFGIPTNAMSSTDFGKNLNSWGRRYFQFGVKYSWQ